MTAPHWLFSRLASVYSDVAVLRVHPKHQANKNVMAQNAINPTFPPGCL